MQILLLAATEKEIQPKLITQSNIDILITGVGLPATLYHLQKRLQQIDYNLVIQAGIAGSFDTAYPPGETVLVKQDTFGDLGTEEKEKFVSIFEAGLADKDETPFTDGWLRNTSALLNLSSLPKVKAVTINKVSDDAVQKQQLISQFDPQIESMEGAALHYVCLQEKIEFIQIRSIANWVGERDRSKWEIAIAIENLHAELQKLIEQVRVNPLN